MSGNYGLELVRIPFSYRSDEDARKKSFQILSVKSKNVVVHSDRLGRVRKSAKSIAVGIALFEKKEIKHFDGGNSVASVIYVTALGKQSSLTIV